MATIGSEAFHVRATPAAKLGVLRVAAAAAVSAALVFILCWVGAFIPFSSPTHAYVALFTAAPLGSFWALCEGAVWSLLFGLLTGAVFATVFNLLSGLDR